MDLIWRILARFGYYRQPDLAPGLWFRDYSEFWAGAHGIPPALVERYITSGIVEGINGWIWATETPELDRFFFEARGFSFPTRWVLFSSLANAQGEAGDYLKLDI